MNGMDDRSDSDRLNNAQIDQMYRLVVDTVHTAENDCVVRDKRSKSIREICYKLSSGIKEIDAGLDTFTAEKSSRQRFVDGGNGCEPVGTKNDLKTHELIMSGLASSTKNIEKILGKILNAPATDPQRFTAGTGRSESHDESCERAIHQSYAMSLKIQLEHLENQKCTLEEKLEEQERASAEVTDLRVQLENLRRRIGVGGTTDDRRPQQCFDNASDRMDALLSMYDRALKDVDKSKRENHELQCRVQTKTSEHMQVVGVIKRLEDSKTETAKCVQELCDRVRDEKARVETSTRRLANLERALVCKGTEADKARCKLKTAQAEACRANGRRCELQRDSEKLCRELRELRAEGRRRAATLAALREKGPKRSAQAVRTIDAMAEKLAGALAAIQGLTDRRGRAADEYQRLLAERKEAACRANAEHRALEEQGHRLDDQLRQLSGQFAEVRAHRRRLADVASAAADQLVGLTDAARRLEMLSSHKRLMLTVKQSMAEGGKTVLEMHDAVQELKMTMAGNRLDELRTAICRRAEPRQEQSDVTCAGDVE